MEELWVQQDLVITNLEVLKLHWSMYVLVTREYFVFRRVVCESGLEEALMAWRWRAPRVRVGVQEESRARSTDDWLQSRHNSLFRTNMRSRGV